MKNKFNEYRRYAKQIEDDFISSGRTYKDVLDKIVIDLFDEMEADIFGNQVAPTKCFCGNNGYIDYDGMCSYSCWKVVHHD